MISALHTSLITSAQRYIELYLKFAFISLFTAFEFRWLKLDQSLQKTLCSREGIEKRKLHASPIWTSEERLYCGYCSKVPSPLFENRFSMELQCHRL
jgi:hypothetical protein